MANSVAVVQVGDTNFTAVQMLSKKAKRLNELLPGTSGVTGEQLIRIAQFEVNRNADLQQCSVETVINAVYDAARLGLMLGREAHLVPYKRQCQMIPDYRGFVTLAYRSKLVQVIDAKAVFVGDKFHVEEGSTMAIHHEPDYSLDRTDPENILFFYAIAWLRNSPVPVFHVMTRPEVDRIRASSAMKNGVPWTKWYDRMGLKSALKYLVDKRLPVTEIPGMADLVELDNRVEVGSVTVPVQGETDDEVSQHMLASTKQRMAELKEKQDRKKGNGKPTDEQPPVDEEEEKRVRAEDGEMAETDG